jgi:outer membrane protein OmpA-like peptidoglycan-associated protein
MQRTLSLLVVAASTGFFGGCHEPEPASPDAHLTMPLHTPPMADLGREPAHVEIDFVNVYTAGSVPSECSGPDPFFRFDSAKASSAQQPTMHNLAECMISGALRGRSIKLTGRTDPRGTEEYNEALGLARAERIKKYLMSQGIDASRMQTASLGKDDASPSPKEWSLDRRVQIDLLP